MSRYHVIIMELTGPELLSDEGYASKGAARKAWATATRGAVMFEDGMAVEDRTGTTRTVSNELRRYGAKLAREGKLSATEEPSEIEEQPAKGFVFDEQPVEAPLDLSRVGCVELPTEAVRPASGTIEKGAAVFVAPSPATVAAVDAYREALEELSPAVPAVENERARCDAKGCDGHAAPLHPRTRVAFRPFCVPHRQIGRGLVRAHDITDEAAADMMRAELFPLHLGRGGKRPPPHPSTAPRDTIGLTGLRALVQEALSRDVELVVRGDSLTLRCVASGPIATGTSATELARAVLPKVAEEVEAARGRFRLAEDRLRSAREEVARASRIHARLAAAGGAS